MRVIICEPGKPPKAQPAKNEPLSVLALRRLIGAGWCEMLPDGFPKYVVMLVNEGGAFSKMPQNGSVMICGSETPVFGTYIICRVGKDGKHYPLEEDATEKLLAGLRQAPKEKTCCLCGQAYAGKGNNAAPLANGLCCNKCNAALVIPERMKQISGAEKRFRHKTVPAQLEGIAAVLCDDYCKYSATAMDEDALDKICANCPVSLLA